MVKEEYICWYDFFSLDLNVAKIEDAVDIRRRGCKGMGVRPTHSHLTNQDP